MNTDASMAEEKFWNNPLREGLEEDRRVQPQAIVIFGASGDLTRRKLVPALYSLYRQQQLPSRFVVLGVARSPQSPANFVKNMQLGCQENARIPPEHTREWQPFARILDYQTIQYEDANSYQQMAAKLKQLDERFGLQGNRLFYLATPPSTFSVIAENLRQAGLISRSPQPWSRLIVEKPFGRDLSSAQKLNRTLLDCLSESQIYRIDHYLGKETVQNLLSFRFANGIFEPLWNRRYVHCVQITSAESLGVEGRGGYFEEAGILRDMVQNHLFQVLCLFGMEPPASMQADAIRDEKVKFLRCLRAIPAQRIDEHAVRAQYAGGHLWGKPVCGYLEEEGVHSSSTTETYVALRLYADNWRWSKVPILLRAAKRMPKKFTEIAILFHQVPHWLFNGTHLPHNQLTIRIQPNEGIALRFGCKMPGPRMHISPVEMEFRYGGSFGREPPEAYERLIQDAMAGDNTLFIRNDETEASWSFISDIHQAWQQQQLTHLPQYAAGSWGPKEAEQLAARDGIRWQQP